MEEGTLTLFFSFLPLQPALNEFFLSFHLVGRISRASSLVASPRPSELAQTLEQESLKFYQYILRISSSLPAPTPPKKKLVTFSELVPTKEMTASTAAQALYHTLSLGMKGVFRSIRQEEAYGEIEIELKE